MFEPEVFRKQMYCIEESTCDISGTFRRPENCAPSLRPCLRNLKHTDLELTRLLRDRRDDERMGLGERLLRGDESCRDELLHYKAKHAIQQRRRLRFLNRVEIERDTVLRMSLGIRTA